MGRKAKYSKELKFEIVKRYLKGESALVLANEYLMPRNGCKSIIKWTHRYEVLGESAFGTSATNKSYSAELKEGIIKWAKL